MSSPEQIYIIDACALMNIFKNYDPTTSFFKPVWDRLGQAFSSGFLLSSIEIWDEIWDDDLSETLKAYKGSFLPLNMPVQQNARKILAVYPKFINPKKGVRGSSSGDPFLVATAMAHPQSIVVTDEKPAPENAERVKVPNVCGHFGIKVLNSATFISVLMTNT